MLPILLFRPNDASETGSPKAVGSIGDAVYGINDGLGAIFGIVSGVSGATLGNSKVVVLAGVVGMMASALSMGSGAYLAAKSEREIYEAEYSREREAVEYNQPEAREVLSLGCQIRGCPRKTPTVLSTKLPSIKRNLSAHLCEND